MRLTMETQMASKKKYPYQDTAKLKRSNVKVNVASDGRKYELPQGIKDQVQQMKAPLPPQEVTTPSDPNPDRLKMSGEQETNTPANDKVQGKSGKMYSRGQIEQATINQGMADQDKVNAGKMNTDELAQRAARRRRARAK